MRGDFRPRWYWPASADWALDVKKLSRIFEQRNFRVRCSAVARFLAETGPAGELWTVDSAGICWFSAAANDYRFLTGWERRTKFRWSEFTPRLGMIGAGPGDARWFRLGLQCPAVGFLGQEVIDQLLLIAIHPTDEDQKQEMTRLQHEIHWRSRMRMLGYA